MLTEPDRLSPGARAVIDDLHAELLLSAASSWEIAIKYGIGRLPLPEPPETYVPERLRSSGVEGLAVTHGHALRVAALEPHHRDPFDRLLVAQAQLEKLTIVTGDPIFGRYDVALLPAV
jgi:PIN domain nuclease of toxin-antitoxin system